MKLFHINIIVLMIVLLTSCNSLSYRKLGTGGGIHGSGYDSSRENNGDVYIVYYGMKDTDLHTLKELWGKRAEELCGHKNYYVPNNFYSITGKNPSDLDEEWKLNLNSKPSGFRYHVGRNRKYVSFYTRCDGKMPTSKLGQR